MRLDLRLRRYACTNEACRRRTFAERLPALIAPRSRRTRRLARAQTRVGVALGGEPGSRLVRQLGMPASGDTRLRLVGAAPVVAAAPLMMIGVDDWAMKKGKRYGTIIVDLERRRPVDLLPDRTTDALADWLRDRPGIGLVARDRSTEYRRAITARVPSATQVADRWHLLHNARQMVERWAAGAHARLRRLPPLVVPEVPITGRTKAFVRTRSAAVIAADSRTRREARYDDVRRRYLAGEPLRAIGKATGLARGAGIGSEPRQANTDDFDAWLAEAQGCSIHAVETFAAGLDHDGAAVRAALAMPWSNGQADGQITKLKLLKRSMYGRAKLDLLRQRLLLA